MGGLLDYGAVRQRPPWSSSSAGSSSPTTAARSSAGTSWIAARGPSSRQASPGGPAPAPRARPPKAGTRTVQAFRVDATTIAGVLSPDAHAAPGRERPRGFDHSLSQIANGPAGKPCGPSTSCVAGIAITRGPASIQARPPRGLFLDERRAAHPATGARLLEPAAAHVAARRPGSVSMSDRVAEPVVVREDRTRCHRRTSGRARRPRCSSG